MARLCPDPSYLWLIVSCWVMLDGVSCTRLFRTQIIVCSVSVHLLLPEFDIPELRLHLIYWSSKYQGVERANMEGVFCRPRFVFGMTFPIYTVFGSRTLDGYKGAVNRWLLPRVVFFQVSVAHVLMGLRKQLINNFVCPPWACAASLNNNNKTIDTTKLLLFYVYLINLIKISHRYTFDLRIRIFDKYNQNVYIFDIIINKLLNFQFDLY